MDILKMAALIVSLGIDTLMTSVSLGVTYPDRSTRIKLTAAFATAEAMMPLLGLAAGSLAGRAIGRWAPLMGALALLAVALWFLWGDNDDDDAPNGRLGAGSIFLLALSISIDELAAGFSMGLLGIPIVLTVILIACQAVAFTLAGLALGWRLKPLLGPWAEKVAGVVLGLLGLWMLLRFVLGI